MDGSRVGSADMTCGGAVLVRPYVLLPATKRAGPRRNDVVAAVVRPASIRRSEIGRTFPIAISPTRIVGAGPRCTEDVRAPPQRNRRPARETLVLLQ